MELVMYGARQFGIKEYFFWMRWLLRSWIFMGDVLVCMGTLVFRKNLNASKPSEHPPQVEECLKV